VVIPATNFKTVGTVRERRERGFNLGASRRGCCGKGRGPRAAMRAAGELVGSSARARIGKISAWRR